MARAAVHGSTEVKVKLDDFQKEEHLYYTLAGGAEQQDQPGPGCEDVSAQQRHVVELMDEIERLMRDELETL